jgi:hypothetical protein
VDIHPPHKPIHNVKDFLLHLLMITIGLFIALTLEAAVQSVHHRHLVREAHENLQREIENNRSTYAGNVQRLRVNRIQLARDIDQLRDLRNGKKLDNPKFSWAWSWNSYGDAAWRTARESGAVAYMDSNRISTYSWVYVQQEYVNSMALTIVNEETRASAPLQAAGDPAKLSVAEIGAMMIKSAEIDLSLETLQTLMNALDDMYAAALKKG